MDIVSCLIKWRGQVLCQKDPFVYLSGLTYQRLLVLVVIMDKVY